MKTERLTMREIRPDDWKDIQAMWIAQARSPYSQYIYPKPLEDHSVCQKIKSWSECENKNDKRCLAVDLGEKLIGYVTVRRKKRGCEVGYCFHSDFQGKGYAKEILSELLRKMNANGISYVLAQTALKNTPSVKLLLSLGFRQIETKKVSICKDEKGNDRFLEDGLFKWSKTV